jgi:hypothetical protein
MYIVCQLQYIRHWLMPGTPTDNHNPKLNLDKVTCSALL